MSKKRNPIVRGDKLTPAQVSEVKRAFLYRWTSDNTERERAWGKMGRPTIPLISDEQWLKEHAFHIDRNGHLKRRPGFAEPHYMADNPFGQRLSAPVIPDLVHGNPGGKSLLYVALAAAGLYGAYYLWKRMKGSVPVNPFASQNEKNIEKLKNQIKSLHAQFQSSSGAAASDPGWVAQMATATATYSVLPAGDKALVRTSLPQEFQVLAGFIS